MKQSILEVIRDAKEQGKWIIAGRDVMVDGVRSLTIRITEADRATIELALARRQRTRVRSRQKRRARRAQER